MSAWQPIDTAPKDGTRVLLGAPQHVAGAKWLDMQRVEYGVVTQDLSYWQIEGFDWPIGVQPTHWMPLPNPPETPR